MSDKISYILEVNDQYTSSLKDFLTHLDKITDKIKGVGAQEKKNQKARVSYAKDQREEFQRLKNWMHETRITQTKSLFLEKQLSQAKKQTALAEKDSAVAGAINLRTASQRRLINQRTIGDLKLIGVQQQQNINNAIKGNRLISARAYSSPSGAFTPVAFSSQSGKFESTLPQPSQPQQPRRSGGFFAGGDGISFRNVAKGMGFYRAIDMAVSAPSKIHDVTVEMDSLRAGLSALIPTVKGMEKATAESEIAYLRSVSNKYGFAFSDVAPSYLKLMGTGGKTDAALIKGILENVGGYGGLIGMSSPALEGTMRGFQDMLSKQVLNAQEVNLQMQQMPGAKPMLHKAFKRFAEKKGVKGITDENVSARFTAAMATGKLPSADILREFVQVLNEMFGEEMIKKSFKLRNEEKRLSNAFQELGDEIGLLTYDAQIGGVRALTNLTKSVGGFAGEANRVAEYMKGLFSGILPEKGGVAEKTASVVGGTAVDLYKMAIGSPFYAAKYGGALALAQGASIMGDDSLKENFGSWAKEEFLKNNFEDLQNVYKTDFTSLINALKDSQKVDITIKSDNNIRVEDVKSSRPSTVKAGQK
jgi:tape measure domain-containing protein